MRRAGYFKINGTETHAAVIFPATFAHDFSAIDTMRLAARAGIRGKLDYVPRVARTIPITENGLN